MLIIIIIIIVRNHFRIRWLITKQTNRSGQLPVTVLRVVYNIVSIGSV